MMVEGEQVGEDFIDAAGATATTGDAPLINHHFSEDEEEAPNNDHSHVDEILFSSSTNGGDRGTRRDGGTGWFGSSLLIVNAALGAGLLNFPLAYHEAGGILTGTLVQLVLLFFIVPALLILAYSSDANSSKTLQEVLAFAWGKRLEKFASFCIALYCFGTCVTFLIIIGDQFDKVFSSLYGHYFCHEWYMNRDFTVIVTSIFFILPFCYPKKIDFLKHISTVGVVSVLYVTILIVGEYHYGEHSPGEIKTRPNAWTDVFMVVPTICFGYQCHVSVIPIYSCFKRRNLREFTASMSLAILICVLTYSAAASYGYLTFGSKVESDILKSYDAWDPYVFLAIIAISIKTYTTYPILSFCGTAAVNDLWVDARELEGVVEVHPYMRENFRVATITLWFFTSLILSIIMPNIGSVIQLLGSLAAVFVFIFPGLCLLKISENVCTTGARWALGSCSVLFLSVGAFIFGCVLTQGIIVDFLEEQPAEIPLCVPKSSKLFYEWNLTITNHPVAHL